MSTFGKRALKKWNYFGDKFQSLRFNNSPKEIQLAILEKWYPIGMTCKKKDHFQTWHSGYTITGYVDHLTYYSIETRRDYMIGNQKAVSNATFTPYQLAPDDNWLKVQTRDKKLESIGIKID